MKIDWECFFDNTSSREELCEFAEGKISLAELKRSCWPKPCKKIIQKLMNSHLNIEQIEDEVVEALRTEGFEVTKYKHVGRKQRYVVE